MLGKLFNPTAASSQSTNQQRHNDSIVEEGVTHDLLFPQLETLYEHHHNAYPITYGDPASVALAAKSADDRGGLLVQASRDVRILVAQKTDINRILFDTHPSAPSATQTAPPASPDRTNDPKENKSTGGLGGSRHLQKARTAPHSRQTSVSQTAASIFSSSASPKSSVNEQGGASSTPKFRGITRPPTSEGETTHTKSAREEKEETDDILSCMFGASGFLSTTSTKIHVKPFTPQNCDASRPLSPENGRPCSQRDYESRRTRLTRSNTAEKLSTFPIPASPGRAPQASRRPGSYVLITKLLSVDLKDGDFHQAMRYDQNKSAVAKEGIPRKPSMVKPGGSSKQIKTPTFAVAIVIYVPNHSPYATSHTPNNHPPTMFDFGSHASLPETAVHTSETQSMSEPDSAVLLVTDRWSMLMRTLSSFETLVRAELKGLLVSQSLLTVSHLRTPLQFDPSILQEVQMVKDAAGHSIRRVAFALRTRPAVTGQDRWTIWKGVTRPLCQTAAGTEPNQFFLHLLTAFLGLHTEWLIMLAPKWYKRQYLRQEEERHEETDAIRCRTVIISPDKMAARRLIFLLSSFLPSNYATALIQAKPTPDAPSLIFPRARHESRQGSPRRLMKTRTPALMAQESIGCEEVVDGSWSKPAHLRNPSDTSSIRSLALPINSTATRKSSTATDDTIQAIGQISRLSPEKAIETLADPRPGSSGSFAALSLQRTLSRSDSNDRSNSSADSHGARYGSARSGFWSSRRGSSTENSEVMASSGEGLGITGVSQSKPSAPPVHKLSKMVEEVSIDRLPSENDAETIKNAQNTSDASTIHKTSPPKSILQSTPPDPFPLTLSLDEKDGIIDVQYSPPASFASIPSTLGSSRHTQTAVKSFEGPPTIPKPLSPYTLAAQQKVSSTAPTAGYLPTYHPDYTLLAVGPSANLKAQIKHSMRTEPPLLPSPLHPPSADGYNEVCTTLLADPTAFSVTRLTLRRKNPTSVHHQLIALRNQVADPAEEFFVEQKLSDADPVLVEALGLVLMSQGSHSSSRAPSRPPSPLRSPPGPEAGGHAVGMNRTGDTKKIVLGALKSLVCDIVAEVEKDVVKEGNSLRQGASRWVRGVRDGMGA